jgi:hypothetical protein
MSLSFQVLPGDLKAIASSNSLLPTGMETPVASTEANGDKYAWLWAMPFLTAMAVLPFVPRKISEKNDNYEHTTSYGV